jgi:CheY-like chemotaxis protein
MLAHELRNPLVPIINAVQIMADNAVPGSRIDWCRELIGRQAEHLSRLVEDLLDVSRISKGMIKLHVEHVDLVQVVARAIETAKPVIDARRHALVPHLPAAPVWVLGDHTRLLQVVGNLLNNAAKFTDPGGRVGVTLGVEDRRALLRVQDNGRGIAPEMLSQVFDLFAQVDPSLDRTEGGLGVGLALVRRLVAQHGGEVAVNSEGLGKGATFEVRLPLLAPDQVPEANVKPPRRTQSLPARKILVVDDNADAALSLAMLLRMGGNVVDVAHDGQVGCEIAERFRPEIALLDIGMPRMNGYDACRRLRSEPWGKDMVLIALTGWGQEEVRTRIYDAGFDLHLIKPVDPALLGDLLAFLSSEPRPSRSSLRRWAPGSGRISAPASS